MVTTSNGYDLHELLSALQKCIRRNLEHDALFFALELQGFNHTALWNRLKVIASEDVSVANPLMPCLIETFEKHFNAEKSKLDGDPFIFLSNAVVCLCRSPKNRSADDLINVVKMERSKGFTVQIPDFALDKHTARGRAMGRGENVQGWTHFFNVGSVLVNESGENPWKEKHRKLRGC